MTTRNRLFMAALASGAVYSTFFLVTPFDDSLREPLKSETLSSRASGTFETARAGDHLLTEQDPDTSRYVGKGVKPGGSSPSVLIVINTVEKYYETRLVEIRRTWMKRVEQKNSMEVLFIGSNDNKGIADVFASNCPIGYYEDSCKKADAITLAYEFIMQPYGQKYDWIFLGDDDLYLFPDNLQRVIMMLGENAVNDLKVWGIPACGGKDCHGFCGGGGYLTNRKTLKIIEEGVDHSQFKALRNETDLFDVKCGRCGDLAISRIMEDRRNIKLDWYPNSGDYVWNFDNGEDGLIASLNGTSDRIPWLYHYPAKGRMDFIHQKGIEFHSNRELDD